MSPVVGHGDSCICGCGRSAREAGGYSTFCFMSLSPMERKVERDCVDEPEDSGRLAEVLRLDRIWGLE